MQLGDRPTIESKKGKDRKNNPHFLKTTNFKLIETTSYQVGLLSRLFYT